MPVDANMNYTYSPGFEASDVGQYIQRTFLKNMQPNMVHNEDATKVNLPLHESPTVKFRRYTDLPPITEPLVEGHTPEGQKIVETAFTAMVKPYGGYIPLTDETTLLLINDKTKQAAEMLARQASLSLDCISRDAMNAGSNVQYAGANTSRGTIKASDKLTYQDVKKAVRTLRRANARPFSDGNYHGIMHTDVYFDVTTDQQWVNVAEYQNEGKISDYELGKIYKVRFKESTNAKIFKAQTYIFGDHTSIVASADFDVANRCMTTATDLSADDARALTGLMVNVSAKSIVTPMCIERVDEKTNKIYFRWIPGTEVTTNWTTANTLKIVPYGGGASGAPVYSTLVYGQDAVGSVELGGFGKNVQIIPKPMGSSGSADPLNQRGTVAWKVRGFCTVILQDDYLVRIESGATA